MGQMYEIVFDLPLFNINTCAILLFLCKKNKMKQYNTLVLGASLKPERYSYKAIVKLRENAIETFAFGLRKGQVTDVTIDTEWKNYESIHTVTLYLNPKRQKDFYSKILALKPQRVIFNPGTENEELMLLLKQNNIAYEIACTLVLLSVGNFKTDVA